MYDVQLMICTAPIPGTVDDFWQMIWDNRIDIVVMLTKTMEGKKVHAHSLTPQCIQCHVLYIILPGVRIRHRVYTYVCIYMYAFQRM